MTSVSKRIYTSVRKACTHGITKILDKINQLRVEKPSTLQFQQNETNKTLKLLHDTRNSFMTYVIQSQKECFS